MAHENTSEARIADVPVREFRQRDAIAWARLWLPILAVGCWFIYWLAGSLQGESTRYSPGPLAHVHATWDVACAACHESIQPLGGNNWLAHVTGKNHVADEMCQTCHSGPEHHQNQKLSAVPGCVTCHREHAGRDQALTRVRDQNCTSCHQNLTAHLAEGKTTVFQNVSAFAEGQHPEFRWLREKTPDPGKVAFNHGLHLMPGLRAKTDSAAPLLLTDVPAEFRERYRHGDQDDKATIQLDCASCHQLDSTRPLPFAGLPAGLDPARPAGATMLPIVFEKHCQACHPLTFARSNPKEVKAPSVRHRLQPEEIRTWLRGHFTEKLLLGKLEFFERPLQRPLPGKIPSRNDDSTKKVTEILDAEIAKAETILYGPSTCQKCHVDLRADKGATQRIEPVQVPQVWLTSARFDHTAHRAVDCRTCHPGAFPMKEDGNPSPAVSKSQLDVLLPGMQTCLECHAPKAGAGEHARGGARFDCSECHRYHAGDFPLHGRGSLLRHPSRGPLSAWK